MTPSAKMSNLVLPTTTYFEEWDIVKSFWHKKISLNEKALEPYYDSKSDWTIITELAKKFKENLSVPCAFLLYSSEDKYLNDQFNKNVRKHYAIESISVLQNKESKNFLEMDWNYHSLPIKTNNISSQENNTFDKNALKIQTKFDVALPNKAYPFWLISSHHSHGFNSQFFPTNMEAYVEINPIIAKNLKISNGDLVKIYNDQGCIEIVAVISSQVPEDVLQINQGCSPGSHINDLVTGQTSDVENDTIPISIPFFDTFVNIDKL